MVDVSVAAQLQQWTFEKPSLTTRPERSSSSSSACSPNLCDDAPETLRIDTPAAGQASPESAKESVAFQERYMSSEEDLSPADDGSDSEYDYDDVVIHDAVKACKARTMSISRWDKGRSCDMAVMVSYSFAGRPKVVELDTRSPTAEGTIEQKSEPEQQQSIKTTSSNSDSHSNSSSHTSSPPTSRSHSPLIDVDSRRPSTSYIPTTRRPSDALHLIDTASTALSFRTAPSSRSNSIALAEAPPPLPTPATAYAAAPAPALPRTISAAFTAPSSSRSSIYVPRSSSRSSVYVPSQSRLNLSGTETTQLPFRHSQWAPTTPASPAKHAFLSSDPYETSTANSASPIIKPAAHKRLRSISMKLALAKIAISPSKKTYDSRLNGKVPQTPSTPFTPTTPQTAPIEGSASFASPNRLRRASTILRPKSRHGDSKPSFDMAPPVPAIQSSTLSQKMSRMVARGANEIEPTLILPPCPDNDEDAMSSFKSKKIKKRKSLMSLMDAL